MSKKIFLGLVIALSIFTLSTLTLAQTTTTTNTPTTTLTKTKPIKFHKLFFGLKSTSTTTTSTSCYKEKVTSLTRQMQSQKKQALSEYKDALKSATSTTDQRDARKTYNNKIKEINNWYYQELKQAKVDCGINSTTKQFKTNKHATTTQNVSTTSTSTATSTQ
jgi:hypothetical protein